MKNAELTKAQEAFFQEQQMKHGFEGPDKEFEPVMEQVEEENAQNTTHQLSDDQNSKGYEAEMDEGDQNLEEIKQVTNSIEEGEEVAYFNVLKDIERGAIFDDVKIDFDSIIQSMAPEEDP